MPLSEAEEMRAALATYTSGHKIDLAMDEQIRSSERGCMMSLSHSKLSNYKQYLNIKLLNFSQYTKIYLYNLK